MIAALKRSIDGFFGRGASAVTIPVMDGPLKPNDRLETAERLLSLHGLDNLCVAGPRLLCSAGADLVEIVLEGQGAKARVVDTLPAPVACLAAGPDGALAIGLEGRGLWIVGGRHDGRQVDKGGGEALPCPTAALFLDEDTLVLANGSAAFAPAQWTRDVMSLGRSGSVWRLDLRSGAATCLVKDLAYPAGLALTPVGALFVTEAWRHRILKLPQQGGVPEVVLANLPAYPFRLAPAEDGGFWVAMLSIRNQLIEFVLRETAYRARMMAEIDPDHWIAPALASGSSFEEVLQGGAVKQMGVMKAWAPTRSYGLVTRCDAAMRIVDSHHSRADGSIHGVTSVAVFGGRVLAAAKGPGVLVALETGT